MKRWILAVLAALAAAVCFGCAASAKAERALFAMDTYMTLAAYGRNTDEALDECEAELVRLEKLFSATLPDSDAARIRLGAGGDVEVSADTAAILETALRVSAQSGGAFDVTIYPLVDAWGFLTEAPHVPSGDEIEDALTRVDYRRLVLSGQSVRVEPGMGVDFGGVAKGYASDRLMQIFRARGVKSAIVSLGGNVYALGARPDGGAWRVGVQDPLDASNVLGVLLVKDTAVITSGAYQRNFTENGKQYHHILNPATGYPADSGLVSVTIVGQNGAKADSLSTALFVLGEADAAKLWRADGTFGMVLVTSDRRVLVTDGLDFTLSDKAVGYRTVVLSS